MLNTAASQFPVEQIDDRSDLYQAGLTSLATVGLMLAIEDAFDIEFPDALLSRKTFRSIDALAVVDRAAAGQGVTPATSIALSPGPRFARSAAR